MTWTHTPLRVFIAVVEHGTFTKAGKQLNLTQSAVSQQVQTLEQSIGAVLLDRSNRRAIRLTAAGRIAYDHARRIVRIEEEMRRQVEDISCVVSGTLTIGASYTVGEYILPTLLSGFWEIYPEVEFQVEIHNTPSIIEAVGTRKLDLGLVESPVNPKRRAFQVEELFSDELVVIVPIHHRLAVREQVFPQELSGETWIVREEGSGTREFTDGIFKAHDIHVRRIMALSSTQGIKEAVRTGLGIALISTWALQTEALVRTVRVLKLSGVSLSRPVSLISPASESGAVRTFADFVRNRVAPIPKGASGSGLTLLKASGHFLPAELLSSDKCQR